MLTAGFANNTNDLRQILQLQAMNLKQHLDESEKKAEGFVTMQFSLDMMEQLHSLAPSVVVREGENIIAYAIVLLQEGRKFYPDLESMFVNLETLNYNGKSLGAYKYYVMGQICVDKNYRGKNVFAMLYDKHRETYKDQFDFIVTEISTSNFRSLRAHERTGFKTISSYRDYMDEWNVVLWDWS